MRKLVWLLLASVPMAFVLACSSDADPVPEEPTEPTCGADVLSKTFAAGSPEGHPDPFGAKAANQARAGRIRDLSKVRRPDDARNLLLDTDFVLANDTIAVFVEGARKSDGYNPFGGEINTIERVGPDGLPTGTTQYGEMLLALSRQVVAPDDVTVLADGSDGKAAIVRARGKLKNIPFLETFRGIFPDEYDFPAILDYVLEPGATKVKLRFSFVNTRAEDVTFTGKQMFGFFHANRTNLFTDRTGYAQAKGKHTWVGFDGERSTFAVAQPGRELELGLEVSGFQYFTGSGLEAKACSTVETDYAEIAGGGPELDGLREATRKAFGGPETRVVKGTVETEPATKHAGALVVAVNAGGKVLSRTHADANGAFTLNLPAEPATVTAIVPGTPAGQANVGAQDGTVRVLVPKTGSLAVTVKDSVTSTPLPVRVQVIPATAPAAFPAEWGVEEPGNGRIYQVFPTNGVATLAVPPGSHRVIVSRGYEYELFDQTVNAEADKVTEVPVSLVRSVDTTGVMCADFHIHANFSADSGDKVIEKVTSAVGDGLELPISSEHEWIIDFQPTIQKLGLTKFASSFPSEELTTFSNGHFGVLPARPTPGALNNGAVDWVGKAPPEMFSLVHKRPEQPILIVNHPTSAGFMGYFSSTNFDNATGKGRDGLWSDEFEAIEVFNDSDFDKNRQSSVKAWFSLLDAGKNVFAVGSSDSHSWRSSPVGYPRTCLPFGHDDPEKVTPEGVRDLVKAGKGVISGGLAMTVEGPGGATPGGQGSEGTYKVRVGAASWVDAQELEVIVDGQSQGTFPLTPLAGATGPGKVFENPVAVKATQSRARHYVVFVAKGKKDLAPVHPGRLPFAVSNPIFF
ncbi:MAG: CehA/McbA family metallohydrolase [Polyangiaceae bacterium]